MNFRQFMIEWVSNTMSVLGVILFGLVVVFVVAAAGAFMMAHAGIWSVLLLIPVFIGLLLTLADMAE